MPDLNATLDLRASDPSRAIGYPLLEHADRFLRRLGGDYDKYIEMRRDGYVRSRIERRKQALLARRLVVGDIENPKRAERKAIEKIENIAELIGYESICSKLLATGLLIGFAVLRVDWVRSGDLLIPTVEFVPQNRFTFAYPEPDRRDIPTATRENLDPKTEIILVQGFELRLLTLQHPWSGERCPKDRFIVYTFSGDESPWGLGLGYSIYPWFVLKQEASQNWLRQSGTTGNRPLLGEHPITVDENDPTDAKTLNQFRSFLRAVSPKAWASLPTGYKASVLEGISDQSADVHERLINAANREITVSIFGEMLYSDKDTGTYGASESQRDAIESALIDADCNLFDEQMQRQLWEPICRLNRLPMLTVRRESRADRRNAETEKQRQDALTQRLDHDIKLIQEVGLSPSEEYIKATYGDQWTLPETTEDLNARASRDNTIVSMSDRKLTEEYLISTYDVRFEPIQEQGSGLNDLFGGGGSAGAEDNPIEPDAEDTEFAEVLLAEPEQHHEDSTEFAEAMAVLNQLKAGVVIDEWL